MKIKAAVVHEKNGPFILEDVDLVEPSADELLVLDFLMPSATIVTAVCRDIQTTVTILTTSISAESPETEKPSSFKTASPFPCSSVSPPLPRIP